jgi:hypothetical protein
MRKLRLAMAVLLMISFASGCTESSATPPSCGSVERLGLLAQSVPTASYLPCIVELPTGWQSAHLVVERGSARFQLQSDRSEGHPVMVRLQDSCDVSRASPFPPRTVGGRSYLGVQSIEPRYLGTLYDVFPGGCVTYRFDFERGVHIALMAQLQSAVGFVSRPDLRRRLRQQLGIELPP